MSYSNWQWQIEPVSFSAKRILCYDSEFVRERHYYPKLALIQLYQPNWAQVQLYDAIEQDITALWQGIAHHDAPLVLHASTQDLELMYGIGKILPREIRDTQLGFALCYPNKAVSYADMVEHYLGIMLPKTQTRSDWLARPLTEAQCDYAADDVGLLARIYPLLVAELQALGRLSWWQEECAHKLAQAKQPLSAMSWYKLRGAPQNLRIQHFAAAQALVDIREALAARQDVPRRNILSDEMLVATARRQPENALDLAELLPPEHIMLQDVVLIESAFERYREHSPPLPQRNMRLNAREQVRLQKVSKYVHHVSAALNIHEDMLANTKQLREWIRYPESSALNQGWRAQFFQALELR